MRQVLSLFYYSNNDRKTQKSFRLCPNHKTGMETWDLNEGNLVQEFRPHRPGD